MNRQQRRAKNKSGGSSHKFSPAIQRLADEAARQYQLGRPNEAATYYAKILKIAPLFAEAHYNLALLVAESGRPEEAVFHYRRAIELKPDYFDAHNNLGNLLHELGQFDDAAICLRSAINLSPDNAEAYSNLGAILRGQNQPGLAVLSFEKAVELRPDLEQAYNNLGLTLRELGRLDEAAACFKKLIDLSPDQAERHNNLGGVLLDQSQFSLAVASFENAIKLRPDYEYAYNNLGVTLRELGRLGEAIVHLSEAIRLAPHLAEAHSTLGATLEQLRCLDEAVACYRKAIEFKPDLADAHHNLAMALLLRGEMAEGWREYEWRWKTPQSARNCRIFAQPQWRGEPAEGRTLLIHAEQGFGDTLQFCRYAALAASRGFRVIMEAPGPLVRLLLSVPGVDRVVARGEPLPSFDLHCPMLSMPLALGTVLATIPALPGYLQADPAQAEAWRLRLAAATKPGPRVGLVWAGSGTLKTDGRRSMAPTQLSALFNLPGLHFFSLQKGGPVAPEAFKLADFMGEMDDFADTAALIANLDLVISVDTAVAHLAAALGKPVWLLDRFDPDWRWLVGRHDSPWYPSLHIYRQPKAGDWDSVLTEVVQDLSQLAKPKSLTAESSSIV